MTDTERAEEFENNDFNFVDLQNVIAWCEIPTFKE